MVLRIYADVEGGKRWIMTETIQKVIIPRASRAECLFTKVKVSLAVAIIKTKPPGVSGREFAEALACRLRRQDENRKEKSEELQQEVLRLRREVLNNRLTGNNSAVPVNALDHSYCSEPDQGSETPELLLPDPPICLQSPPTCPHGETDLPQVNFLQALLSLQRLDNSLCFSADGGALLVDSVCRLLDSVVRFCRDAPPLGPGMSVLQACNVSARSMQMFCSHRLPDEQFRSRVEAALRDLTEILLHKKGTHRVSSKFKGFIHICTEATVDMGEYIRSDIEMYAGFSTRHKSSVPNKCAVSSCFLNKN
ncbi:Meiosis-specific protein MEI4 [Dissostichus eleginoides]|uniref:Meiosis-specific protein MEI4 n=1 Tax=Dissostichus eleginoides TaxID=100907 RepID=A0AAD9BRY8_DISEL|nr:Meiosis-specific protein MEI4 [Dissostichus eleginoides]